ncbi:hypothetical protein BH20ACT21_BH20ACT21_18540 [soil metagenome]
MEEMTTQEAREFLRAGTRTGKLATVSADGSPHVAPIWFELDDDGNLLFTTGAKTVKGRNLRREPRLSLCVDDENPPFAHVVLLGVAEISEDRDALLSGQLASAAATWAWTRRRNSVFVTRSRGSCSCG